MGVTGRADVRGMNTMELRGRVEERHPHWRREGGDVTHPLRLCVVVANVAGVH